MKIVTAFDSFKGCMTAVEACRAAEEGIRQAHPNAEISTLPMSDGGEGKSDRQTLMGKVASGVLARAVKQCIPCYLLSGQIEDRDALLKAGFAGCMSINSGDNRPLHVLMQKEISMQNLTSTARNLTSTTLKVVSGA